MTLKEPPFATCTVVIPCFNGEQTLEQAFASVMNQTFRDHHLVIVDDASRDGCLQLAARLARGRDNVTVVPLPENKGQSHARNRGVEATRGPFVAFLDQDDSYHPDYLAHAMDVFAKHPEVDAVRLQPLLSVDVHPAQHDIIAQSLGCSQVLRRKPFLFTGGWPESRVFREHGGGCEDIAFNNVFAMLFRLAESTHRFYNYNHRPGNALDKFLARTEVVDGKVRFLYPIGDDEAVRQEIDRLKQALLDRMRRLIDESFAGDGLPSE